MSNIIQRIANYFQYNYEGTDETAPAFEITVEELREIASINTERCRLLAQERVNYKPSLHKLEKIRDVLQTESNDWICYDYMDAFEQIKRIIDNNERTSIYETEESIADWKKRVKKRIEAVVVGLDWNSIKEIFDDRADTLTHQIYKEKLYFNCIFENNKCIAVEYAFEES